MATALEDFNPNQFLLLNWIIWAAALLITTLRLVVRYRKLTRLYWDDAFAISGIIWLTIMAILNHVARDGIYLQIDLESGRAPSSLYSSKEEINFAMIAQKKMQFAFMVSFWNCLWSAKGSLLMFYRRLFKGVNGYMKWWWFVVVSCILTWLISLLTDFMVCLPLNRRFSLDPGDRCNTKFALNAIWVATSLDIATDIMVAVLPISLLFGLRISLKQKIGIGAIFCLGIVVIFFSTFRLVKIMEAIRAESTKGNLSVALWSMLEAAVAVVVGSLPTLKSLISRRGDTDYISGGQKRSGGGMYGAKGPSVRLYNMEASHVRNTVRAGYGSDEEALNARGVAGITKTQEVSISSEEVGSGKGKNSIDNFAHMHGRMEERT